MSVIENILEKHDNLLKRQIFLASPNQTATHTELFDTINGNRRHNVSNIRTPIYLPKWLIKFGLIGEIIISNLNINPNIMPKEQMWMFDYIDKQIITDSSRTQNILNWKPTKNIHNELEYIVHRHKYNGPNGHNGQYKLLQENRECHNYDYAHE